MTSIASTTNRPRPGAAWQKFVDAVPRPWRWAVNGFVLAICGVGFTAMIWPRPPLWLLDVLLAAPLLAALLGLTVPSESMDRPKRVTYGFVGAIFLCGPLLGVHMSLDHHTVDVAVAMIVAVLVGVATTWALWWLLPNGVAKRPSIALIFVLIFAWGLGIGYALGAFYLINQQLDRGPSSTFTTMVQSARISHGRQWRYLVVVTPWPLPSTWKSASHQVSVPPQVYNRLKIGRSACLTVHPGFLHARWFELDACL